MVGALLDPYSARRGCWRSSAWSSVGAVVADHARHLGDRAPRDRRPEPDEAPLPRGPGRGLGRTAARAMFTLFIFLSMTAYFMQELILEPYAGPRLRLHARASPPSLSGAQNGGMFVGMLAVGIAATGFRIGSLRPWVTAGCLGSAVALCVIAAHGPDAASALLIPGRRRCWASSTACSPSPPSAR